MLACYRTVLWAKIGWAIVWPYNGSFWGHFGVFSDHLCGIILGCFYGHFMVVLWCIGMFYSKGIKVMQECANTLCKFVWKCPKQNMQKKNWCKSMPFYAYLTLVLFLLKNRSNPRFNVKKRVGVGHSWKRPALIFNILCNFVLKIYIVFECYIFFFLHRSRAILTLLYAQCGRPATFSTCVFPYQLHVVNCSNAV